MKDLKLSNIQKEVLVGILLGDANLQTESQGRTYRLRVSQSHAHKEYLFHLYEIFKDFVKTPPNNVTFYDKDNKSFSRWTFSTIQHACFRHYGQEFYPNLGEKVIPKSIHKKLTPRAIAYWYMDDGAQKWKGHSQGIRFCTDSFCHEDVKRLATLLEKKYAWKTSVHKQGIHTRIGVSTYSYDLVRKEVYDFFIASMLYKFPEPKGSVVHSRRKDKEV
jgi:hypothetical protein